MRRLRTSAPRGSIFESVENIKVPQSRHNLSYINKLDCDMGQIVPFYIEETSPGQIMNCTAGVFGRMMPTITPIMQEIYLEMRYFYVPYRILWENFEEYATGEGSHEWPFIEVTKTSSVGNLADLFGCDVEHLRASEKAVPLIDAMPFRAYFKIYNEYFRDENLIEEIDTDYEYDGKDGSITELDFDLLNCAWKKDYFTSALPWTQRGNMAQFIADVFLKKDNNNKPYGYQRVINKNGSSVTNNIPTDQSQLLDYIKVPMPNSNGNLVETTVIGGDGQFGVSGPRTAYIDPNGTLAVTFDLQQLRIANQLQKFFERSARVGNRYCEYILGMYGVKIADYKLQRPLYLGGGIMPFQTYEVMQNEQAQLDSSGEPYAGSTPQGNLAGIGKLNGYFGMNKPYYCPEDGLIIGLLYLRPTANYVDGTRKQMLVGVKEITQDKSANYYVKDRFERLYNPFFEHLGEEGVFTYELLSNDDAIEDYLLHLKGADPQNLAIFGYQSRYAYRKYRGNEVHGLFKDDLLFWHLGRTFSETPQLNGTFINCNPSKRIYAVEDDSNHFLFDIYNKVDAVLPMSQYSIPRL